MKNLMFALLISIVPSAFAEKMDCTVTKSSQSLAWDVETDSFESVSPGAGNIWSTILPNEVSVAYAIGETDELGGRRLQLYARNVPRGDIVSNYFKKGDLFEESLDLSIAFALSGYTWQIDCAVSF